MACECASPWLAEGGENSESSDSAYDKARDIYEGGYMEKGEVERSFAQRRVYADFDQLCASGQFAAWAKHLYGGLFGHFTSPDAGSDQ